MKKLHDNLFAVTAPGLEEVCSGELASLGMEGVTAVPGGVEFTGGLREIYLANLWLRTASRVLIRVGEVRCRDFPDLFRKSLRLPWGRFIRPGTRVRVRASSRASRLGHTGRIAETVSEAIDRALGREHLPEQGPEQLVFSRFDQDRCLLSVDSSGELLHRRGYRIDSAHAPLRETLGAGILLLLGWDGKGRLYDPMCGSGTLVIEGAMMARRQAPGLKRMFAFMDWPRYRPGLWEVLLSEAHREIRNFPGLVEGSDLDPSAVAAASRNAERAGVAEGLVFHRQALDRLVVPEGPGLLLCNPPYGERLGGGEDLRNLYGVLGRKAAAPRGWKSGFLSPEPSLAEATGLPLKKVADLNNGGIPVGLYLYSPG